MTETLNILKHSAPEILIFGAMVEEAEKQSTDLSEHFNLKADNNVEVELKVNGVSLKFSSLVERLCSRLDEEILEKAKELLSASRLSNLERILSEAEWKIEQELEELMKDNK